MRDILHLAWCYLRFNRWKTVLLTASITLILFLPAALNVMVSRASDMLTYRAESTPLLAGVRGSTVDLALAALYFREPSIGPMQYGHIEELSATGLGRVIPLHLRFTAGDHRIVGTSLDYFDLRGLELHDGRRFALLGEAVIGADVATRMGIRVGDAVISTPAGAFDVAGSFPLRMNVVGVLAPTGSPDDDAVFVDLKTAWVIEGIGHGHDDVTPDTGTETEGGVIVADPSVLPYTEITPENLHTFHFHGDQSSWPVDAAIVIPTDTRAGVMLRGRFPEGEGEVQIVTPLAVVEDLVETMFSVRDAALIVAIGLGLATVLTTGLVVALSLRIRRRELDTMRRIGAPVGRIRGMLALEIGGILIAATISAAVLTALASRFGGIILRIVTG